MDLKALDHIFCRTPVFSVEDRLEEKWPELKELIRESSPTLFELIKDLDLYDLQNADKKIRFSVWKYFNRARFRATPFGRLAAFSIVSLNDDSKPPLILAHDLLTTDLTDWSEKDHHVKDFHLVANVKYLQTNSTIYRLGTEIRFIRFKKDRFEIGSVAAFPELDTILTMCTNSSPRLEILDHLFYKHGLNSTEVNILLEQLLDLQLLLSDQMPNITGEDYFKRLNIQKTQPFSYTISERKVISGGLERNNIQNIPDLIRFLQRHLPEKSNFALAKFKNEFARKFEYAAVPLTLAMDPEIGVGYDDLAQTTDDQDLIDLLIKSSQYPRAGSEIVHSKFHRFLLNALTTGGEIKLDDFEEPGEFAGGPLPNSINVMLHYYGNQPVVEVIGGCTANSLIGRFTVASKTITELGQQISDLEKEANPDVIFFDVAYQAEKKVDNVNRRKHLYDHELPILTWSSHHSPIQVDDILVAVRNAEIVLWSKTLQKRLIPRIPSAYNYARSDLALYRFICDMQHQGIRSDLNFKLPQFFPDLHYYPRTTYKDIIVSPAMWLVPVHVQELCRKDEMAEALLVLQTWLSKNKINFPFKVGTSDQKLRFDPGDQSDLNFFILYCRQHSQSRFYISESLSKHKSETLNEDGQSLVSEYIINYTHQNTIYQQCSRLDSVEKKWPVNNKVLPGGEWLYFEIYCHPSRSNYVLQYHVSNFLQKIKTQLKKWFFIRYENPGPHIRLRLHLIDESQANIIINELNSTLAQDFSLGLITDLQIKTYDREVARYGLNRMAIVEEFFFTDSQNIIAFLSGGRTQNQLYALALRLIQNLLDWSYQDLDKSIAFACTMADAFGDEFGMDQVTFKKVNQSFSSYRKTNDELEEGIQKRDLAYKDKLLKILKTSIFEKELSKLLADLFHMHVNRLFSSNQRCHEAIIYQYLVRILKARRGKLINQQEYPI